MCVPANRTQDISLKHLFNKNLTSDFDVTLKPSWSPQHFLCGIALKRPDQTSQNTESTTRASGEWFEQMLISNLLLKPPSSSQHFVGAVFPQATTQKISRAQNP